MKLQNDVELANTRRKLARLEKSYETAAADSCENPRVKELTLISLKRLINQLTEEIVRYESRQTATR